MNELNVEEFIFRFNTTVDIATKENTRWKNINLFGSHYDELVLSVEHTTNFEYLYRVAYDLVARYRDNQSLRKLYCISKAIAMKYVNTELALVYLNDIFSYALRTNTIVEDEDLQAECIQILTENRKVQLLQDLQEDLISQLTPLPGGANYLRLTEKYRGQFIDI